MHEEELRRLNAIFQDLEQELPIDEIDRNVNDPTIIRGIRAEEQAAEALAKLPFVSSVRRMDWGSSMDLRGIDLLVGINSKQLQRLDIRDVPSPVGVQVKSSRRGVNEFIEETARKLGVDEEVARVWLLHKTRAVIIGQGTHRQIQARFQDQLREIGAHHLSFSRQPKSSKSS